MIHTYIKARTGRKIDIDRATYLMDQDLFADAHREVVKWICPTGFNPFDIAVAERMGETTERKAQRVWSAYCRAHEAKYKEPFAPDVDPNWDS